MNMIDKNMTTAKEIQYVVLLYASSRPLMFVEKIAVMRLTGMKRIVTFANKIVMRVRRSTAWDCFSVIRLKFWLTC